MMSAVAKDERILSAVGYVFILCLLPLLLKRRSPFAQHHGKQGLVILVVWVLLWIGNIIPVLGQIVWMIGSVLLIILIILGIINAYNGKMWQLPVFGEYAKKIQL